MRAPTVARNGAALQVLALSNTTAQTSPHDPVHMFAPDLARTPATLSSYRVMIGAGAAAFLATRWINMCQGSCGEVCAGWCFDPSADLGQPAGSRSRRLHQGYSGASRRQGTSRWLDGGLRPRVRASPPVGVVHGSGRSAAACCRAPRLGGAASRRRRSGRPCAACLRRAGAGRTL